MSKKYGLILPVAKTNQAHTKADFKKPSIFESDSDSDGLEVKKLRSIGPGVNEKRQARRIQEKALEEDPTIFQYDELYDAIESKRADEKQVKNKDARAPKYINRLLECADRRKLEYERRLERTVQKEREKEGEEFADKESFVTSAYRLKLEELKQAEEREKREDYLEAIGDVTKQQDLGGFYRHLFEQKLKIKEEQDPVVQVNESSESSMPPNDNLTNKAHDKSNAKARAYRKRHASDDEEGEISLVKKGNANKSHLQSNLDADSDFSIDESTDSDSNVKSNSCNGDQLKPLKTRSEEKDNENGSKQDKTPPHADENGKDDSNLPDFRIKIEPTGEKEIASLSQRKFETKKDIWKKRTLGAAFEEALARYYERKSARNG